MDELSHLEKIGEGTQGEVYKAHWQGQEVIYKKRKLPKPEDEDKPLFQREFHAWQYGLLFYYFFFSHSTGV